MNFFAALIIDKMIQNHHLKLLQVHDLQFEDPLLILQNILMQPDSGSTISSRENLFDSFKLDPQKPRGLVRQQGKPDYFLQSDYPLFHLYGYGYHHTAARFINYTDIFFYLDNQFLMKTLLITGSQFYQLENHIDKLSANLMKEFGDVTEKGGNYYSVEDDYNHKLIFYRTPFYAMINLLDGNPVSLEKLIQVWIKMELNHIGKE